MLFSIVAPPTVHEDSLLPTFSPKLICCLLDDSHSDGCEVLSRGFNLHFPEN